MNSDLTNAHRCASQRVTAHHDDYPALKVFLESQRSRNTRRAYESRLDRVAECFGHTVADDVPWLSMRAPHLELAKAWLDDQGLAPSTVNLTIAAMKALAKSIWRAGLLDQEELARIRDVPGIRVTPTERGRHLSPDELERLLKAAGSHEEPRRAARNGLIVRLMASSGLRRSDVSRASVDGLRNRGSLLILTGKGGKSRKVPIRPDCQALLRRWLGFRGLASGPLFCQISRDGYEVLPDGLGEDAVYRLVQSAADRAGVACTPHDLRRTATGNLLRVADPLLVARILGHSDPRTTMKYDRRFEDEALEAVMRTA